MPDTLYLTEAAAAEGARAAAQGTALLRRLGWPAERAVPLSLLLALSAVMRLYFWEQTGHVDRLPAAADGTALPAAEKVLDSVVSGTSEGRSHLDANRLARRVFGLWHDHMAWRPLTPHADVLINPPPACTAPAQPAGHSGPAAIELLARLLWSLRGQGIATAGGHQ